MASDLKRLQRCDIAHFLPLLHKPSRLLSVDRLQNRNSFHSYISKEQVITWRSLSAAFCSSWTTWRCTRRRRRWAASAGSGAPTRSTPPPRALPSRARDRPSPEIKLNEDVSDLGNRN